MGITKRLMLEEMFKTPKNAVECTLRSYLYENIRLHNYLRVL